MYDAERIRARCRPFPVVIHTPYIVSQKLDLHTPTPSVTTPSAGCFLWSKFCFGGFLPILTAVHAYLVNLHSLHGGLHVVTEELNALHVIQNAW